MNKIAIFSPNPFSLYSTTVTEMLIHRGLKISSIYVRKLINPGRVLSEYRRDGSRLLKKVWKKLILRHASYEKDKSENLLAFRRKNNISISKLDEFHSNYSIPVISCASLNEIDVVKSLQEIQPDLVVFTGGGLIRQEVLSNAGNGVLNCHMGFLPPYRGMDVVEWPILEDHVENVGITVHFMDQGLDTGDILRTRQIHLKPGENISDLRERIEPIMCQTLVDTSIDFLEGRIERQPQKKQAGKQYFRMHPILLNIVNEKLKSIQKL